MKPTRRDFLQTTAALAATGLLPQRAVAAIAGSGMTAFPAREATLRLAPPGYPATAVWEYDSRTTGPALRVAQGARVQRRLVNELPQATSVHWHGLRSDNAMDGVAGLTQDAVATGDTFDYDFIAPDAGTYWFHAHNRSVEQMARGLYGALIVEEPDAPDVDRDEVLILDDWLLDPETAQIDTDFSASHARSHAGRIGNVVTTNGNPGLELDVAKGERLRLRLINAANARIFVLALSGVEGWAMAYDGMPLAEPEKVAGPIVLGPGQRVDLFVDVTADAGEKAYLIRSEDKQGYAQVALNVTGAAAGTVAGALRPAPPPLPPNPRMAVPGVEAAKRFKLVVEGGAMGKLDSAVLDGERKTFQQLADANQFWAFNGVVGMTDAPLARLSRGETARLEIFNGTSFPHAFHLHGMHFREIQQGGALGPLRDTLLSFGGQAHEIAFVADNPGKWLFHCHMLSHAEAGMITWLDVA